MADIIDMNERRNAAEKPDAENIRKDEFGRPLYRFLLEYKHADGVWGLDLWAYDFADAEAKAASISKGVTVVGQAFHSVTP